MAAFGSLSDRLNDTFDRLRGKGKLTEAVSYTHLTLPTN